MSLLLGCLFNYKLEQQQETVQTVFRISKYTENLVYFSSNLLIVDHIIWV